MNAKTPFANGVDLRILPLGDSITWGYPSSDGNGYRQELLSKFDMNENKVTYIGSQHSGSMRNNSHEGWPGANIFVIAVRAKLSLPKQPNVILLMAGTNDVMNNEKIDDAPHRLGQLLDNCISACPDAVVILAQITPVRDAKSRATTFNNAIPGIVQPRLDAGHKVVVVNMQNSQNGLTTDDLYDGLHLNDTGYAKMANVWWDGINTAASKGWVSSPKAGSDTDRCHDA